MRPIGHEPGRIPGRHSTRPAAMISLASSRMERFDGPPALPTTCLLRGGRGVWQSITAPLPSTGHPPLRKALASSLVAFGNSNRPTQAPIPTDRSNQHQRLTQADHSPSSFADRSRPVADPAYAHSIFSAHTQAVVHPAGGWITLNPPVPIYKISVVRSKSRSRPAIKGQTMPIPAKHRILEAVTLQRLMLSQPLRAIEQLQRVGCFAGRIVLQRSCARGRGTLR